MAQAQVSKDYSSLSLMESIDAVIHRPSLRDQFAMAALASIVEVPELKDYESAHMAVAKVCYRMADAMMEARKLPPSGDKVGSE